MRISEWSSDVCSSELATDRIEVVDVAGRGHRLAIGHHRLAIEVGTRHVGDVVAAVAVFRPAAVVRGDAARARLHRDGEVGDLHAGIVVVELALHVPAAGVEQAAEAVTDRRGAAVADMKRAGRVGRSEEHTYAITSLMRLSHAVL